MLLRDLMDIVSPGLRMRYRSSCPPWPPDVFAVSATLLRRAGAYVRVVDLLQSRSSHLLNAGWPKLAQDLGREWQTTFSVRKGKPESSAPRELTEWWTTVVQAAAGPTTIESVLQDDVICSAVLRLCLVADEASEGIGLDTELLSDFQAWAAFRLAVNGLASLGWEVPPDRVCVLPKQHTPQRGMSLRSLSHHLALLPVSDVRVQWLPHIPRPQERDLDLVNLLLLPWPEEVMPGDFRVVEAYAPDARPLPPKYRYFAFTGKKRGARAFEDKLRRALKAARTVSDHIDGIVFPELALSLSEYKVASRVAWREGLLLIAGVGLERGELNFEAPANVCLFLLPSQLAKGGRKRRLAPSEFLEPSILQRKHHRWCLDRNQIIQYGLGGVLPASCDCWEYTGLGERQVSFVTLGSWMTMTALICEDLARQDPVSEIVRSVGPNLVVALLMDGPQVRGRWSSRYASVLAEDPGSSVLSLTSLGMAARSKPEPPQASRNRVIGLWRDVMHGEKELEMPEGCTAAVLSLSRETIEEFSADARGDGGSSHFPVFAGFHPLNCA